MANLILTNYCNADCAFCFAADSRVRMLGDGKRQMDEAEVRDWLDFVIAGGIRELRLLGGEPSLHPKFAEFVRLGAEKGCSVTVFTNGVMPDLARDVLRELDPEVCSVVVNVSATVRKEDISRQRDTLKMLGPRAMPGMTLTSPVFTFAVAIAMIDAFGLRRTIRVGIANPTWRGSNVSVHPKQYPAIGQALLKQSAITSRFGIDLDADCGFVRCMFGDRFEELTANGFHYHSRCTPVLDLCAGGTILPCFGLSNLVSLSRSDFSDAGEAYGEMSRVLEPWHAFGIYPECAECPLFETEACCGGCLSARLRRFQPLKETE